MKQYLLKVWMTAALSLLVVGGVWGQESYTSGYPNVSDITHESATLNVSASVGGYIPGAQPWLPGTAEFYVNFVVVSSTDASPSIVQVLAGQDGNGVPVGHDFQGKIGLMGASYEFSQAVSGLAADADYVVYLVTTEDDFQTVVIESTEPTVVSFSTTAAPTPLTATLTPADDALNVPVSTSNFVLTFSEDIEFTGAENLYAGLYKNGSSVEGQLLSSSNGNVVIDNFNNSLTISFSHSFDYNTGYDITIPSGAVQAVATSVEFPGLSAGEWSFTTEAEPIPADPPYVETDGYFPAPGTPEVSRDTELRLTFNEEIEFGDLSALFLIHRDGSVRPLLPGSEEVSISVSELELIIDLSETPLTKYNTDYYVLIEPGFVKSKATGADFEGIALVDPGAISDQVWFFTTETAPPVWAEGYPSITNQTIDDFVFNAWADQEGVFYGVVTLNSSPPTVEAIEQGLNGSARISFNEEVNDITSPSSLTVFFDSNTSLGNTYFLHTVYKAGGKYSEVATLQVDRVVPEVLSSNPAEGTIVFPVTKSIEILFSEEVVGVDGSSLDGDYFSFVLKDEPLQVDFSISVVTESEMTKVVLTPTPSLIEDTTYTLTVSPVYDLSGNPSEAFSISFETDGVSTWTGGGNSSDWSDPLNWGEVDFVRYKSVVIESGSPTYPEVTTGTIDVHNLTIQPGAVLTHTGGTLNVTGLFHLQSSDVVNATYLNNGGALFALADSIRVDQVLSNPNLTYHISSPTNAATRLSIGSTQGVFFFNNLSGAWESNLNNSLDPGVGYITRSNNNLEFRGELNFTSFSRTVYRSTNGFGWNLIGNPYTAMLDFSQMITEDIEPTFWLWQNESGLYGTMNMETEVFINLETSYIPSNHSFFVKVKDGVESTSISFSPDYLTANTTTYLKAGQVSQVNQVKLAAVSGEVEDETAIAFISSASAGIDKYDSEKYLGGSANVLELFSLVGNNRLAINGMPLGETVTIPLGYATKTAGDYSIQVNLNTSDSRLFLRDNVADVTKELLPGSAYSFNVSSPGTNHSRFSLVVERVVTGVYSEVIKTDGLKAMIKDRRISVLVSPSLLGAAYNVVDMSGRLMLKGVFNEEGWVDLGQLSMGAYIIQCYQRGSNLQEQQKIVVY